MRIVLLLAVASSLLPSDAVAQPAATLKLSWDHCAGDGAVLDRSFACDTNTGGEVLVASMVINDGAERAGVTGFTAYVDVASTATNLPSWWVTTTGSCRPNAILADVGPFVEGGNCVPWYASGPDAPLGVLGVYPLAEGPANLRIVVGAAVPAGGEPTLPAGQELVLFRISLSHAKSTGTGSCDGCTVPTCIGFGHLKLQYAPGTTPDQETFDGTAASAVTWQGAYVAGYAPTDPPGATPYWSYLSCATGPVPAQNRTWGLVKTLYR